MIKWDSNKRISRNVFDTIGRTPLVKLNKIPKSMGISCEILGKLEYFSPSGSLKDRIYLNMFNLAEKRGQLRPGMTVLECSTGNAGIGCSFVAAVKGYPCIIVMPEGMSEERKMLDIAYGTQMVYTPGGESDVDLALQKLEEIRQTLTADEQTLLTLRIDQQLSWEEIGEVFSASNGGARVDPAALRKRFQRLKDRLAELLRVSAG